MIEFITWTLLTLSAVTLVVALAEKYGVEIAIGIFAVLTVVANIIAVKLVTVGGIVVPAGVIVYSATFLITDVLDEIYGKEYGMKAVITGFVGNVVALLAIVTAIYWSPAPFAKDIAEAFVKIFKYTPRIVFASMVAYIISQTHDVYAFYFWKKKTKGKHLWLRNNASTIVSQFIDTCTFITLAFYGTVPIGVLLNMIFGQYLIKVTIALMDTPFMYIATITHKLVTRAASS